MRVLWEGAGYTYTVEIAVVVICAVILLPIFAFVLWARLKTGGRQNRERLRRARKGLDR